MIKFRFNPITKIICAVAAVSVAVQGAAFAAVRTDMKYSDAVAGAVTVDESMIYETESNVTKGQLAGSLFNYAGGSDAALSDLKNAYNADFTLYFGADAAQKLTMFRAYVCGSDTEEENPPITVLGSSDGTTWTELAKIASPVRAAWNEESINADTAYSYIKVESAMTATDSEEIAEDGTLTEGTTNTYHQRISCAAFFSEAGAADSEEAAAETAGSALAAAGNAKFSDVGGHWAQDVIERYAENGYINGYPDGTFKPDNGVTVAEFCRIVSAVKGINYRISSGSWSLPYIREMAASGVIENTDFDDYDTEMTREQVAKAALTLMTGEYYPKDLTKYEQYIADIGEVTPSHKDYVIKTYISGVLGGYEDGSWHPTSGVTRAEILSVLDRVFNKDMREVPEVIGAAASESPEQSYYYSAAVQIRNSTNASSMQYRLYGSDAQYMEDNDDATGLKLSNEIQGAQGFAMVLRYDVSDIKKKNDKLEKLYLEAQWLKGGTAENALGLWYYDYSADKTEWNNPLYYKNVNGSAVAGDDTAGYNSVVSNITATLPTWGNTTMAVTNDKKTKPIVSSPRTDKNTYVFDLTGQKDEILKRAGDKGTVEFIITTVNYDDYEQDDDKPQIFTAGAKAPMLKAEYNAGDGIDYTGLTVNLKPADAELNGGALNIEEVDGVQNIAYFVQDQEIVFNFDAPAEGDYLMRMNTSASDSAGGTVKLTLNGESFEHEFPHGEGWAQYSLKDIKTVHLNKGENTLSITGVKWNATYLINIRDVVFEIQ